MPGGDTGLAALAGDALLPLAFAAGRRLALALAPFPGALTMKLLAALLPFLGLSACASTGVEQHVPNSLPST